jgi:hypothetical protein
VWINHASDSAHQRGLPLEGEKLSIIMRDALNVGVANSPAPKVRWILITREGDLGFIINMDKNREKMYIHGIVFEMDNR